MRGKATLGVRVAIKASICPEVACLETPSAIKHYHKQFHDASYPPKAATAATCLPAHAIICTLTNTHMHTRSRTHAPSPAKGAVLGAQVLLHPTGPTARHGLAIPMGNTANPHGQAGGSSTTTTSTAASGTATAAVLH